MKIVFTKHAEKKFRELAAVGFAVSSKNVTGTIANPEHVDKESDKPKIIASKPIDKRHIIRVVFKIENDIITIITFYPTRKERYYGKTTSKN